MLDQHTKDVQDNKVMAILAYLIFFIPLIAAKDSRFAMFHANQGFNNFLLAVAVNIIGSILPFIGWFIILPIGNIVVFIFAILGIVNAVNGQEKELPLIGKLSFFKF